MSCALVVSIPLSGAALAAERVARMGRAPTRWIWLGTMFASMSAPFVTPHLGVPHLEVPTVAQMLGRFIEAAPALAHQDDLTPLCNLLWHAWVVFSTVAFAALILSVAILWKRERLWRRTQVAGSNVLLAPDAGPAVFGFLQPRIVVPLWITRAPLGQQTLIIAHEQSHVAARDSQLIFIALFLRALMPWSPMLWWQLSRLRNAIEVDCDARLLKSGLDPTGTAKCFST